MRNEAFEDKRLLEALDYIDDKFIAEVTEDYEVFDHVGKPTRKMRFRIARQYLVYAACLVLLAFAMPIVGYIVPQIGELFGGNAGNIGESETVDLSEFADMSERDLIEHIGEVPAEFIDIVEQNLFNRIEVSGGKIIKSSADEAFDIEVYDLYGKLLHKIDIQSSTLDEYWLYSSSIHALSDETYLMVIPHNIYYEMLKPGESVRREKQARAIRFDKNGKTLFDTTLGVECSDFEFFYETEDTYLIISGSYQKSNSYFIKLDKSGKILKNIQKGGNEHDRLYWIYYTKGGDLTAYMREHTFSKSSADIWKVIMDEDFNIIDRVLTEYTYVADALFPDFRQMPTGSWNVRNFVLGYNPGHKDDSELPKLGYVSSVIEYDDFVLIISERNTKGFEYVPMIYSTIPSYTETVYTAYTYDGQIIWRSAVDSTDYARLAAVKKAYEEERERINNN